MEGNSHFFPGDCNVQLMLKTEVPSKDVCAQGCSSCALTRLILWHGFSTLWLPGFLAVGSVILAETGVLMDARDLLAHSQAPLPRPAASRSCVVSLGQWMWAGLVGTAS